MAELVRSKMLIRSKMLHINTCLYGMFDRFHTVFK